MRSSRLQWIAIIIATLSVVSLISMYVRYRTETIGLQRRVESMRSEVINYQGEVNAMSMDMSFYRHVISGLEGVVDSLKAKDTGKEYIIRYIEIEGKKPDPDTVYIYKISDIELDYTGDKSFKFEEKLDNDVELDLEVWQNIKINIYLGEDGGFYNKENVNIWLKNINIAYRERVIPPAKYSVILGVMPGMRVGEDVDILLGGNVGIDNLSFGLYMNKKEFRTQFGYNWRF